MKSSSWSCILLYNKLEAQLTAPVVPWRDIVQYNYIVAKYNYYITIKYNITTQYLSNRRSTAAVSTNANCLLKCNCI